MAKYVHLLIFNIIIISLIYSAFHRTSRFVKSIETAPCHIYNLINVEPSSCHYMASCEFNNRTYESYYVSTCDIDLPNSEQITNVCEGSHSLYFFDSNFENCSPYYYYSSILLILVVIIIFGNVVLCAMLTSN